MPEHVGLFLPLPERLARQYPADGKDGEDTSPPHVTLCYIGDVEAEKVPELEAVLRRICQAIPPLELELLPPRTFQNDEGQTILHSRVGCPILELVHRSIRSALERRGFNVQAHDQFKPHVTIEYIDPGERSKLSHLAPKGRWRADTVGFWVEDDRKNLPLGHRKQVKAATDGELRKKVVEWFRENRNPSDDQVHELAEQLGIDPHEFETVIYSLLTDCVTAGTAMKMIAGGLVIGDRIVKDAAGVKAGSVVADLRLQKAGKRTAIVIELDDGSTVTVGRWTAFEIERGATAKRDVIACLLRADRPDLANAVANVVVAARAVYYHGTSTVFAKRILSEGFVPNPKRKVWDGETGKFESYYGTYASNDFDIAWDAAKTAARKFNGRPTVFELQVETRGALIDEDELPDMQAMLEEALDWPLYDLSEGTFPDGSETAEEFIDGDYIDQIADEARSQWLSAFFDLVTHYDFNAQKKLQKHLHFKVFFLAYSMLKAAAEGNFYNNKPFDDDVRDAEREIIKAVGSVGKLTQNVKNVRVTEPITFRGANRILSAIVRSDIETSKPEVYSVFGKPSSKLLGAAKKVWGQKFKVEPKSLSAVPGFQDPYDDRHGSFF